MDWVTAGVALASAIVAAGGRDLFSAIFNRRRVRVDAAQVLASTALQLNSPLRQEVDRLEQRVAQLSEEALKAAQELHNIRTAVFAPDATIDGLRDLIRYGRPLA